MAAVRCNNEAANIYVDEQWVGSTVDWTDVWSQTIASDTRLITVECYNYEGSGGLMTSVKGRPTNDITWRCSSSGGSEWHNFDFDDSGWGQPYIIGTNTNPAVWAKDDNFPDNAKWIWKDSNFNDQYTTSYCRGTIGECTLK